MHTKNLVLKLENILEWNGSFDEFADDIHAQIPLFLSSDLDTIEKELIRSAKGHHSAKKNRYIMNLLEQPIETDISGLQDSQSLSPECTITSQKYVVMRMDEFLDSYPLPTNMKEVER